MILIISEKSDNTSNYILDWFYYYGKECVRVNKNEIEFINFIDRYIQLVSGKTLPITKIKSIFFRRGKINVKIPVENVNINELKVLLNENINYLNEYINYKLYAENKAIGNPFMIHVNKLIILELAKKIGLTIPESIVTNKIRLKNNKQYITKSISGNSSFIMDNEKFVIPVSKLTMKNKKFSFAFIQEYIDKKYELRIFYLLGECYSMAIFSQKDEQTQVDYRRYNKQKPNRNVPYKLPKTIKVKLINKLKINCGSIDMIVTPKDEYVFLEVNPQGQFGMVSYPCNYNIEEKIAKYL